MHIPGELLIGLIVAVGGAFLVAAGAIQKLVKSILSLDSALAEHRSERDKWTAREQELTRTVGSLNARIARFELTEEDRKNRIAALECDLKTKDTRIADLEMLTKRQAEQLTAGQTVTTQMSAKIDHLTAELAAANRTIAGLTDEREQSKAAICRMETQIGDLQYALAAAETAKNVAETGRERERAELQKQIDALRAQLAPQTTEPESVMAGVSNETETASSPEGQRTNGNE